MGECRGPGDTPEGPAKKLKELRVPLNWATTLNIGIGGLVMAAVVITLTVGLTTMDFKNSEIVEIFSVAATITVVAVSLWLLSVITLTNRFVHCVWKMTTNTSLITDAKAWEQSFYFNNQRFIQSILTLNVNALTINCVSSVLMGEVPLTTVQLSWVNFIMGVLRALTVASGRECDAAKKREFISSGAWCHMNGQGLFSLFMVYVCMVQPVTAASGDQKLTDSASSAAVDKYSWTVLQITTVVTGAILTIVTRCITTCCLFWYKERREEHHRRLQRRFMLHSLRREEDASHRDPGLEMDLERGFRNNVVATVDNREIHWNNRQCQKMVLPKIDERPYRSMDIESTSSTRIEEMSEKTLKDEEKCS